MYRAVDSHVHSNAAFVAAYGGTVYVLPTIVDIVFTDAAFDAAYGGAVYVLPTVS